MTSNITVHCIVKNEEKWIWYAINSILDIADKVIVYDTGSTDNTVKIIKSIKNKKITFQQKGNSSPDKITKLRREQLQKTNTEWVLILDGDEIWPESAKKELIQSIRYANQNDWGVVIRAWNLVGDIYHFHPESQNYHWPYAPKNYKGWANLRILRRSIPNLNVIGRYPMEAYVDLTKAPIQNYGSKHLIFLNNRYLHTTYLVRSTARSVDKKIINRTKKEKFELGHKFPKTFKYPSVFFKKRPSLVKPPWIKRSKYYTFISMISTPIKEFRRRSLNLYNPK